MNEQQNFLLSLLHLWNENVNFWSSAKEYFSREVNNEALILNFAWICDFCCRAVESDLSFFPQHFYLKINVKSPLHALYILKVAFLAKARLKRFQITHDVSKFYFALGVFYLATSMSTLLLGVWKKISLLLPWFWPIQSCTKFTYWLLLMAGLGNVLGQLPDPH